MRWLLSRSRVCQRRAAIPAELELARADLAAGRAMLDRRLWLSFFIVCDDGTRVLLLMQLRYPELRIGRAHWYFAECGHRVFVEKMHSDAGLLEQVAHEVCVGEIGGGIDAFHVCIIARKVRRINKKAARLSSRGLLLNCLVETYETTESRNRSSHQHSRHPA